mgnify:CR=1 FL=1
MNQNKKFKSQYKGKSLSELQNHKQLLERIIPELGVSSPNLYSFCWHYVQTCNCIDKHKLTIECKQ